MCETQPGPDGICCLLTQMEMCETQPGSCDVCYLITLVELCETQPGSTTLLSLHAIYLLAKPATTFHHRSQVEHYHVFVCVHRQLRPCCCSWECAQAIVAVLLHSVLRQLVNVFVTVTVLNTSMPFGGGSPEVMPGERFTFTVVLQIL